MLYALTRTPPLTRGCGPERPNPENAEGREPEVPSRRVWRGQTCFCRYAQGTCSAAETPTFELSGGYMDKDVWDMAHMYSMVAVSSHENALQADQDPNINLGPWI